MPGAKPRLSRSRGARPRDQVSFPQADQSRRPTPLPAGNVRGVLSPSQGGTGAGALTPDRVVIVGPEGVYTTDESLTFDPDTNALGVGSLVASGAVMAVNIGLDDEGILAWESRSQITSPADGQILVTNSAGDDVGQLLFGGVTADYPALARASAALEVKLADDSDYTELVAKVLRITDGAFLLRSAAALDSGAGAATGTLANAPTAGDPAKWLLIDDNGTVLAIPAWELPS